MSPLPEHPGHDGGGGLREDGSPARARLETARTVVLEHGYSDPAGGVHRECVLRAALARDEIRALSDLRVHLRPDAFLAVMLARTVTRLGTLRRVDAGVIESLASGDRSELERLYRELNGYADARDGARAGLEG